MLYLRAGGQAAVHAASNRQPGLLRRKPEQLVNQREELLGLLRRGVRGVFRCGRLRSKLCRQRQHDSCSTQ